MRTIGPYSETDERRWTTGSYLAAGFALFLFLYNLVSWVHSASLPTDGWMISGSANSEEAEASFRLYILDEPTPIQAGDTLLAVNGQSTRQLADAGHAFYRMEAPDLPDGTKLQYTLLRETRTLKPRPDGDRLQYILVPQQETLTVEVPVRRIPFWQYFTLYKFAGISQWVQLFGGLFFLLVSLVVFLLRPGNRAAHALLFIGVTFGLIGWPENFSVPRLLYPNTPVSIPFDGWTLGINPSLMYLVLAFPRPKLPLRRYPALTLALIYLTWPIAFNTAYLLNLDDRMSYVKVAFVIYPIQIVIMMVVTIITLIHSAWKVRDPVGRSQFKWMLAGVFSFVFLGVGGWLVSAYIFPETMSQGNWLTTAIGWFLLPLCLAVAITRYRLFDIDVIIRKTLVYGLLSGLLSLVYFGGVAMLSAVGGQSSPVVIVVTTLAIAALFNTLRRRVQDFIDRRFYRQKYDAEKALAEFAAAASRETDLAQLSGRLTHTVQETLQPEQVSLWIRSSIKKISTS